MSSPARGPRPPFAAASSARPILNLNRPGQAARRRSEDQQPSEASLLNRRPTAPPTIFPLSQVPTGPRIAQPSRQDAPAGPSSTPYQARQGPRIKAKKRHTAGGWANSSASSSTSESRGPARRDVGWGSRAAIAPSAAAIGGPDKGKAPDAVRGDGYAGRPITTGSSNPLPTPIPVPANPRCTLYITGLPSYTTEEDMYATFSPFGQVTRVSVKSPKPNHTFAHVAFATANEALAAFEALDGRQPDFVSATPPGAGVEAGSSRGMKITFAETTAERDYRRMSGGDPPPAPLGLFRVPQTPDPASVRVESEVKPEPSPSPQKGVASASREGAGLPAGGPSRAGPQDSLPARILTPRLVFQGNSVPSIGHGSLTPPDDRIYRPTYLFMYEYVRPLRSRPEREVIDDLEDQLWRDHGRMRVEDWSIGPKYHTTVVRLRVSVPPETIDKYRLGERRKSDPARTATEPPEPQANPSSAAVQPAPISMDFDSPNPGIDSNSNHAVLFDDAGIARFRAPLPDPARGSSVEANKQRRLFLIAQVKKLGADGDKVVLSSRIEGEEVVIEYMQEETEEDAGGEGDGAEGAANVVDMNVAEPSRTAAGIDEAVTGDRAPEDVTAEVDAMQDVKPVIPAEEDATSPAAIPIPAGPAETSAPRPDETAMAIDAVTDHDQDEEVDELATPPPPPDAARFPLPALAESRADSKETYNAVPAFIREYFRRFDESRSSLESFYTPNALFSIRINDRLPARLSVPPVNFSPHWISARNKVASTPVAITNTIRALPAVSHNVDRLTFTARTVPELHVKSKNRAPIVLHVVGQFEEFLEKTVRSFCRTFIIVPRPSKTMGGASDGYLVHSDQLSVSYYVRDEPSPLLVQQPPFSPAKRPPATAAVIAPPVITTAPVTIAAGPSTRPFSQFQPHPALARMHEPVAGPSRISASAPTPRAAGSTAQPTGAQSDSDRIASSSPLLAPARPLPTPARSPREANESDSAHTSVSPEIERRPLPTSSAASVPRSAASLGKRRADEETIQPQRRKKRNGDEPAAAFEAAAPAAGTPARKSGASAQSYTAADIERMIQQEVAAQLARAGGSGRGPSPRSDADDEPVASTSDAASSSREGKKKRDKNDTSAKAKRAAATAAAATAEAQKRRQQEKGKAATAKAGPPLGTGLGTSDARILLTGGSQSLLHGFDGRSNKLRHMVDTGSSYLAVSHIGDIVEFAPSSLSLSTSIHKLRSSSNDTYRVDDFAWSDAKDTLVVGYLGVREGKTLAQPPNQVILYKKEPAANGSRLVERKVDLRPHKSGGVTALATLPGTGRLRFVTGGEDKQLYIWSRSRATQEYTAEEIRSDHSSMITSLAQLPERNWLVSSGKDKRLKAYDLEHLNSTWQALLHDPIMTVQSLSSDPNLVLARMSSSRDQFAAYDVRRPPTSAAVLTFGYDLAPHRSSKGALAATNMGRYFRGAQCDTIFAFPDYAQGVKLWDLRNVRDAQTQLDLKRQDVPDLGRGKVVQVAFRGRSEMCLMDMSHVTRAHIQG